jgi:hypothetical protein
MRRKKPRRGVAPVAFRMSSSIGFSIFLRARSARTPVVVADVHRRRPS